MNYQTKVLIAACLPLAICVGTLVLVVGYELLLNLVTRNNRNK